MVECGKCGILPSDEIPTILKYGFFEENLKFNYLKTFLWYEFKSNESSNERYGMDIFFCFNIVSKCQVLNPGHLCDRAYTQAA